MIPIELPNRGRFVTFDRSVPLKAVAGAEPRHLEIIGAALTNSALQAECFMSRRSLSCSIA